MENAFRDDRVCFVCGEKNPFGLKLRIRMDAERGESTAEVTFRDDFQGWAGIVHGGLVATVLDEALVYAAAAKGLRCVTGEITARYNRFPGVSYKLKAARRGQGTNRSCKKRATPRRARGPASGKLFKITGNGPPLIPFRS
jgi:hypothetical protein